MTDNDLQFRLQTHLACLYPDHDAEQLCKSLLEIMRLDPDCPAPPAHQNHWDERAILAITYGDSFQRHGEKPLHTLHDFLHRFLRGVVNNVHILPFFPYSSDDGFAVMEYTVVNESLGSWSDIEAIAAEFGLMADLVINHCSARSRWFDNFKQGVDPGRDFFFVADPGADLSGVVRPRTSELLRPTETADGTRHVWCTFSHDQVDFDFRNPDVMLAFASIIRLYLDRGVKWFRLDAVAFLWKIIGTPCINLEQTHEFVRLLRSLIEHAAPEAIVITETNIPNRENLAYFGNANEAHGIYNFSLPPLLLNTLMTGSCRHLKSWMMSMPPAQHGTFYLNFVASHDGIGLRPAEGLLSDGEIDALTRAMQHFGGRISWRSLGGEQRPYEINIALFDAMAGTLDGVDDWQIPRFICAHAIMIALEGIPAFYVHSLLGTQNDHKRLEHTSHNRHINRHQWDYDALLDRLTDERSHHYQVLQQLQRLIKLRTAQAAFHPNATQFVLHMGDTVFAFWRQSADRRQSIFCLNNISCEPQTLQLADINLIDTDQWTDLISGEVFDDHHAQLVMQPYQSIWLTNVPVSA